MFIKTCNNCWFYVGKKGYCVHPEKYKGKRLSERIKSAGGTCSKFRLYLVDKP